MLQNNSLANVVQQEIERGPVRETFRTLGEAGLVGKEENRGHCVPSTPIEEAPEIFELRAAIKELVGRLMAKNITSPQPKELKSLVIAIQQAVKGEGAHHYHLLNRHRLVEMAGIRMRADLYRKLIKDLPPYRRLHLADGWLMPLSANKHRLTIKGIASSDQATPGRVIFTHAMENKERTSDSALRRRAVMGNAAAECNTLAKA